VTASAPASRATLAELAWPRRTERLLIRPATAADVDACWAFRRRPEVGEWLGETWTDRDAFAAWMTVPERMAKHLVVEHEGRVVGDAMVEVRTPWAQAEVAAQAEGLDAALGWVVDPAEQGRGYATEVARDLLVIAFDEMGLRRVVAECFADNVPSWKVMERVGMRREARNVRESLHRDRGWLDGLTYALQADEWRERRGAAPPARPSLRDVAWPRPTERLLIRPSTRADAPAAWRYNRHPDVVHWLWADADEEAFTARWSDPEKLPLRLSVEHEGELVGDLMLKVGDALSHPEVAEQAAAVQAEVGWSIDPAHQGRGFATEAAADLLAVAFDEMGLRRVYAQCFADNVASWRVMEKVGMRRELASKADSLHRERGWSDGYEYALLADEWRAATGERQG
jgi:RimJ/RimL family protein N-acetyltransferase